MIFGKFKKRNPHAVGSNRRILDRNVVVKIVQDKADEMTSRINDFRHAFKELFEDGLPSFWDQEGRRLSQENYHILLVQIHMDHSKFDYLVKGLTGKVIVDKLTEDFEILQ